VNPSSYYVHHQAIHLGPQHGRIEIDISVSDHALLQRHQAERDCGAAALQAQAAERAAELQRGPLADAVRNTRGRLERAEADETRLRTQMIEIENDHRNALLGGQDCDYPSKQVDSIRSKLRSVEVLKDALRPVLQEAEARYADAVKAAKANARQAWLVEAQAQERTFEAQLVEAVADAAARLELQRAVSATVANEQHPVYASFNADVS
jgi:hypothetical protein